MDVCEHKSDNIRYCSNPPKNKCIKCGKFYSVDAWAIGASGRSYFKGDIDLSEVRFTHENLKTLENALFIFTQYSDKHPEYGYGPKLHRLMEQLNKIKIRVGEI